MMPSPEQNPFTVAREIAAIAEKAGLSPVVIDAIAMAVR
jgi:hypothetical protein